MTKAKRTFWIVLLSVLMMLGFTVTACGGGNTLSLSSPKDGAKDVSTLPLITWTADDKAEWYELTISEHEDLSSPAVNESPIEETSFQVKSALKNETKYYMLLRGCSESYTAEVRSSFTTKKFEPDEPREPKEELTLYSFDYADQAALDAVWTMHGGGDPVTMTLVDSPLENGGKAARLEYDSSASSDGITRYGWSQAFAKVDDDKYVWAGFGGVKFYLEADGTGTSFRFIFVERVDDYFYADITMSTNYKGYVTIPFSSFKLDTDNSFGGGEMTLDAVKKVEISTVGSNKGSFLIDDISLVKECEDTTYLVEKGEGDSLVYDGFSYADTAALQAAWLTEAGSSDQKPTLETKLGVPAMKAVAGTAKIYLDKQASISYFNAMKITYFTEVAGELGESSYIAGQTPSDFSGTIRLEACTDAFKTAVLHIGGGGSAVVWNVQFKNFPGDTYISKIEFVEDYSAPILSYTTTKDSITIVSVPGAEYSIDGGTTWSDTNTFTGLATGDTYTVAIRYKAAGEFHASEKATEQVTLTEVSTGDTVYDDFESYADTSALTAAWSADNSVAITLENREGGGKVMKVEHGAATGAQAKRHVTVDWSAYKSLSVTFRTSTSGITFDVTLECLPNYDAYPFMRLTGNGEWQTATFPFTSMENMPATVTDANLLIKPSEGSWVEIDEIKLIVDEATNIPEPPVEEETEKMFDDFEGYQDSAALTAVWQAGNGAAVTLSEESGTKAMKVTAGAQDGAQAQREVMGHWNDYKSLSVKYRTNASGTTFSVTLNIGENYPHITLTGNGEWQTATFPFTSLDGQDEFPDYVSYFLIKPNGEGNWVEIDEIKLIADEVTNIPEPPEEEVKADVFDDFEGYQDGDALTAAWSAYNAAVTLSSDGTKAMKVEYTAEGAQAQKTVNTNWLKYKSVSVTFRTSAKDKTFSITLFTGNDYPYKTITGNGQWQTVIFKFSSLTGLNGTFDYVADFLIKPSEGSWVEIDEIVLFENELEEQSVLDDFGHYADSSALTGVWKEDKSTVTLETEEGKGKVMKIAPAESGAQAKREINGNWSYTSITITFRTSAAADFNITFDIGGNYPNISVTGTGEWQTVTFLFSEMSGGDRFNGYIYELLIKPPAEGWVEIAEIVLS